ncbi:MAG TPA: CBS domain-containing protein [Acidimicrobiales bacterium]
MQVKGLLANKGREVATISQERTVEDALQLLRERGIGALVVTGPKPPLVGILSERDVVRALATDGVDALTKSVLDVMSTSITTCGESTTIDSLMALMTNKRIRHVPVIEDGELRGIISIGDVVKSRVDELETEKRELIEYVSAR